MREYVVIFEKGPEDWGAYAPDLPGLGAAGASVEEAEHLIREGIEFHLQGLLENGDPIPEPTARVGTVQTEIIEGLARRLAKSA